MPLLLLSYGFHFLMATRFYFIFILTCLVIFSLIFSLSQGSTYIPFYQLLWGNSAEWQTIFFDVRLPRTLTAFISGGLLALSGSLMQLLLQNPLADPYLLGVSGSAAFFTLLMMLLGFGEFGLISGAWFGSVLAIILIFFLARKHRFKSDGLLISGMAIACGFSAGISVLLLLSQHDTLHSMLFWLTGDLNDTRMPWFGLFVLISAWIMTLFLAPGLNVLSRGDIEAKALGLSCSYYRCALFLLSSLLTATAITLSGCIGFIGLIIPHFARIFAGFDQRILLPLSMFLGGSLLTIADTLARTLFAPQQIPVGVVMALIGVPIFIWLLQQ